MLQSKFQVSLFTAFFSVGSGPMDNWSIQCKGGEVKQVQDDEIKSSVLQIQSKNVNACFITSPVDPKDSMGVQLPFLTLIVKNLGQLFTFEITILDSENIRRRLRMSSYHKTKKLSTFMVTMPVSMNIGWNLLHMNLAEFIITSFKTTYVETVCVKVHANCRLRRIYFSDQLYKEDELPKAYRVFRNTAVMEKPKSILKKKAVGVNKKSTTDQL
ncbi:cilia- and flagella-associated protein 20-like [Myzus persicae]|uniref:cilia- and flagella-associated protein 20-like n=1 Tax=Myzus persicae TaxID=13164 RepID=UPI000B939365|nr:cilia- and flagella-associated protein 20-like [Myzus persicae]